MEGRTHRFIAITMTAPMIFLMSAAASNNIPLAIGLICLLLLSAFFYGRASNIRILLSEMNAKTKKAIVQVDNDTKKARLSWLYKKLEAASWFLLLLLLCLTIITADFLPDLHRGISVGLALIALPLGAIAGSFLPDWDWDFGEGAHRNPLLHSYLIPFSIWIFCMIVFPYEMRYINIIPAIFCVGYGSHLLADCVNSKIRGVLNILRDFFNFQSTAGDIRQIPEHWEHKWLSISGAILIACFGFTLPRIYGTYGFDWVGTDFEGNIVWASQVIVLIIIALLGIGFWFIIFLKAYSIRIAAKKPRQNQKRP